MSGPRRNRLGLARERTPIVRFGDVDIASSAEAINTREGLDVLPEAQLRLKLSTTPDSADYLAPVVIAMREGGLEHELFQGSVLTAVLEGEYAVLKCAGGQLLVESLMGRFAAAFMTAPEIAHMAARAAGLDEDRIVIPALEDLPLQTFEVLTGLEGIEIDTPIQLGSVRLLPAGTAEPLAAHIDTGEETDLVEEFLGARAYALSLVTETVAYRAESDALAEIDWALAWLSVHLRYGLVRLPDGRAQPFSRVAARAQPRRGPLVGGRALQTGGRWIHAASSQAALTVAGQDALQSSAIPNSPSSSLRQAVLAARRAADDLDPIQRIGALWEAIEFLVRGIGAPTPLARAQRKALRLKLIDVLPPEHHERVDRLIALINEAPLMDKLRLLIERDSIPFSAGDFELLKSLREVRNEALHGGDPTAGPKPEELEHAVALLSRIIFHTAERTARGDGGDRG